MLEALYFKNNENGNLEGMISTHIDDFNLARSEKFLETMTEEIKKVLDVLKVEDGKFRFTGIDVERFEDRIELSMNDYTASLNDFKIR